MGCQGQEKLFSGVCLYRSTLFQYQVDPSLILELIQPSSLIIDELLAQTDKPNAPLLGIACVYCDYSDQKNQSPINILGSLLKQLLLNLPEIPDKVISTVLHIQRKGKGLELGPDFSEMLRITLDKFSYTFICIDALDELEGEARISLLESLKELLLKNEKVRLFLTGRPHIEEQLKRYLTVAPGAIRPIEIKASDEDIRRFITHKIDQEVYDPTTMNAKLKAKIVGTIAAKSEGMYERGVITFFI